MLVKVWCAEKGDNVIELDSTSLKSKVQERGQNFFLVQIYNPKAVNEVATKNFATIGDNLQGIEKLGRLSMIPEHKNYVEVLFGPRPTPYMVLYIPELDNPQSFTGIPDSPFKIIDWVISYFDPLPLSITINSVKDYIAGKKEIYPKRYLLLHKGYIPQQYKTMASTMKGQAIFAEVNINYGNPVLPSEVIILEYPVMITHTDIQSGQNQLIVDYFKSDVLPQESNQGIKNNMILNSFQSYSLFLVVSVFVIGFVYFTCVHKKKGLVTEVLESSFSRTEDKLEKVN